MYTPSLARLLIKACNLAYCIDARGTAFDDTPETRDDMNAIGFIKDSLRLFVAQPEAEINACYCGETADETILAFRGTLPPTVTTVEAFYKSLRDWTNDAQIKLVQGKNLAGRVHQGFLESLDALWDWIIALDCITRSGKPLRITGHSKGGALVYLAAYRLAKMGIKVSAAYSFAAPRPGDKDFARAFDQMVLTRRITQACRIEYHDDLVPHLPPCTSSWRAIYPGLISLQHPSGVPHIAASPEVMREAHAFLARLDRLPALPPYASAGELQFIDWNNVVVNDSFVLEAWRNRHLATMMAELKLSEIAMDHASDGGYMQILCKP